MITTRSSAAAFPSSLRMKKTSLVQQRDVEKKKVYVRRLRESGEDVADALLL